MFEIVILLLALGATYLIVAFLSWLVCVAFGIKWSWLLALGIWAAMALIRMVLPKRG